MLQFAKHVLGVERRAGSGLLKCWGSIHVGFRLYFSWGLVLGSLFAAGDLFLKHWKLACLVWGCSSGILTVTKIMQSSVAEGK